MSYPLLGKVTPALLARILHLRGWAIMVAVFTVQPALAQYLHFRRPTDTVLINGNTVQSTAITIEARVLRQSAYLGGSVSQTGGRIWGETKHPSSPSNGNKRLLSRPSLHRGGAEPDSLDAAFLPTDTWVHYAYVRDGTESSLFIDGERVASGFVQTPIVNSPDGVMALGCLGSAAQDDAFCGLVDWIRVSNIARYHWSPVTPPFTPPEEPTPDADTQLLFTFDEPPGSTTVMDKSANGFIGTMGAGFASATKPLLLGLPAAGGFAHFSRATDTIAITGDTTVGSTMTIESRVFREPAYADGSFPTTGGAIWRESGGGNENKRLNARPGRTSAAAFPGTASDDDTLPSGVWTHYAFVRNGTSNKLYVNGVEWAAATSTAAIANFPGGIMSIGCHDGVAVDDAFSGYIDWLRVSDSARYLSNFTPPAEPEFADASTRLLFTFDESANAAVVQDRGTGLVGTLGTGFSGATRPALSARAAFVGGELIGAGFPPPFEPEFAFVSPSGGSGGGSTSGGIGGARVSASIQNLVDTTMVSLSGTAFHDHANGFTRANTDPELLLSLAEPGSFTIQRSGTLFVTLTPRTGHVTGNVDVAGMLSAGTYGINAMIEASGFQPRSGTFTLTITHAETPCQRADFDSSGSVSPADIFFFLNTWFGQIGQSGDNLSADIDNSGGVTPADIFFYLDLWFTHNGTAC